MSSGATASKPAPRARLPYGWSEEEGYHAAWYPVHMASELKQGQVAGRDFLGTRIVLYRDPEGRPVVQAGFCPHLGADLSDGELVDGQLRCPYHYWRFAGDGRCTHIPSQGHIPRTVHLFNYPTAEKWGLIWAFNGPEPLYEVPSLPDVDEEDFYLVGYERGEKKVEYWLPTSNAVDFAHLSTVHGLAATLPERVSFHKYHVEIDSDSALRQIRSRVAGVSAFIMVALHKDDQPDRFMISTGYPVDPDTSNNFTVLGLRKRDGDRMAPEELQKKLDSFIAYGKKIQDEDEPVLKRMRFRSRGEAKLVKLDKHYGAYLDYLEKFPRHHPFDA